MHQRARSHMNASCEAKSAASGAGDRGRSRCTAWPDAIGNCSDARLTWSSQCTGTVAPFGTSCHRRISTSEALGVRSTASMLRDASGATLPWRDGSTWSVIVASPTASSTSLGSSAKLGGISAGFNPAAKNIIYINYSGERPTNGSTLAPPH